MRQPWLSTFSGWIPRRSGGKALQSLVLRISFSTPGVTEKPRAEIRRIPVQSKAQLCRLRPGWVGEGLLPLADGFCLHLMVYKIRL